jgi:hypothetical protein
MSKTPKLLFILSGVCLATVFLVMAHIWIGWQAGINTSPA